MADSVRSGDYPGVTSTTINLLKDDTTSASALSTAGLQTGAAVAGVVAIAAFVAYRRKLRYKLNQAQIDHYDRVQQAFSGVTN